MNYNSLLILGPDDIGKRAVIKCVCNSLGFQLIEITNS